MTPYPGNTPDAAYEASHGKMSLKERGRYDTPPSDLREKIEEITDREPIMQKFRARLNDNLFKLVEAHTNQKVREALEEFASSIITVLTENDLPIRGKYQSIMSAKLEAIKFMAENVSPKATLSPKKQP